MIIKSYGAPTIAAALKKIKEELGGDAIVLKTRVCPEEEVSLTGQRVEVTACIDEKAVDRRKVAKIKTAGTTADCNAKHGSPIQVSQKAAEREYDPGRVEQALNQILSAHRAPDLFADLDSTIRPVFLNLLDSDIPVEIAHRIASGIRDNMAESKNIDQVAMGVLLGELEAITRSSLTIHPGMKLLFIGSSGAGKTSVLGKVAAQLCTKFGQKLKLLSLDHMKISANEEIGAYADLLGLPVGRLEAEAEKSGRESILLIDTPAISRDEEHRREMQNLIQQIKPDLTFFVFSVGTRSHDLIDAINLFEVLRPDYLIASHLDETDRWGGIMTMAEYLNIPLAFITDSPAGMGKLMAPDTAAIARRLLKLEVRSYE
nr:hypothetical protein [candidate division Zixibacteria bacterium]